MSADDVEILEKTTPFQGYFRVDRYVLKFRRFDGGWSPDVTREIFERGHAVALVLYDPVRDEVGLCEQFRPGALAAGWHPWLIELPAGIIDEGQTPEAVAIREAKEETGLEIDEVVPARRYLVTPGGSTESMQIFAARIDATKLTGVHGLEEEGEDIRVFPLPAEEAFSWVESGRICNGMTIIGLDWLAKNRDALRARWSATSLCTQ
ncbi:MAG TPA: NUDIX domain-containing protein [Magnetospirillaceae bacterium]|nr:NUDIX domain-containing protein [Magnetospirillaceae bacterium]